MLVVTLYLAKELPLRVQMTATFNLSLFGKPISLTSVRSFK